MSISEDTNLQLRAQPHRTGGSVVIGFAFLASLAFLAGCGPSGSARSNGPTNDQSEADRGSVDVETPFGDVKVGENPDSGDTSVDVRVPGVDVDVDTDE